MWKYQSEDFNNISLHDHIIDKIVIECNDIIFIFNDGFDVVKTRPHNDTGKSKHTITSQVILKNANFLQGIIFHWDWKEKRSEQEKLDCAFLLNSFARLEVLQFKIENNIFTLHVG